jgi:thiamine biosynthesis lipoprotein
MKSVALASLLTLLPSLALPSVTRARYLMGTICEISVLGSADAESQIRAAFDEAQRVEGLLSTWRDDSTLSRLNRGETTAVSPELYQILEAAARWSRDTNGAFNPLVRPLIDAWKTRDGGALPRDAVVRAAIRRVRIENVRFENQTVALENGARFEEGAFGKGYAIDRMLATLRRHGARSALINFGGQLGAFGTPWETSIADPHRRHRPLVPVTLRNQSLSTSSGSEQSFTINGRRFTHIIDPRTGEALPPRGSVSVVHPSGFIADILSTALYVMGPEDGLRWARAHDITAIFITDSGQVIQSREELP